MQNWFVSLFTWEWFSKDRQTADWQSSLSSLTNFIFGEIGFRGLKSNIASYRVVLMLELEDVLWAKTNRQTNVAQLFRGLLR